MATGILASTVIGERWKARPMPSIVSTRMLLGLLAAHDLGSHHIDLKHTLIQPQVEEEIYIIEPRKKDGECPQAVDKLLYSLWGLIKSKSRQEFGARGSFHGSISSNRWLILACYASSRVKSWNTTENREAMAALMGA